MTAKPPVSVKSLASAAPPVSAKSVAPGPLPAVPLSHDNGFGVMRLAFALLVVVSHMQEQIYRDASQEMLKRLFGSITSGSLAVDGFFVISGALITASWLNAGSWRDYLWRRVVRIYPGFLVAFAFCVLVVGPLAGAQWPGLWKQVTLILRSLLLLQPKLEGGFVGLNDGRLNGAMWTIPIEFGCYLMVGGLGLLGLLRRRWLVLALTLAVCLVLIRDHSIAAAWFVTHPEAKAALLAAQNADPAVVRAAHLATHQLAVTQGPDPRLWLAQVAELRPNWRLVSLFLAGVCYHLWRADIPWRRSWALVAGGGVIGSLCLPVTLAEIGFALFGGYLIFYLAGAARGTVFARINARTTSLTGSICMAGRSSNWSCGICRTSAFGCPAR